VYASRSNIAVVSSQQQQQQEQQHQQQYVNASWDLVTEFHAFYTMSLPSVRNQRTLFGRILFFFFFFFFVCLFVCLFFVLLCCVCSLVVTSLTIGWRCWCACVSTQVRRYREMHAHEFRSNESPLAVRYCLCSGYVVVQPFWFDRR
jgi:hypothetical protein